MPLEPRVKRFLNVLPGGHPPDARTASVGGRRAGLASLMDFAGPRVELERIEDRTLPGPSGILRIRLYSPSSDDQLPGLIYFHGGGFVAGTLETHDPIARALAQSGLVRVASVDYRLAPEHRVPAALEDALSAVRDISAHASEVGIESSR